MNGPNIRFPPNNGRDGNLGRRSACGYSDDGHKSEILQELGERKLIRFRIYPRAYSDSAPVAGGEPGPHIGSIVSVGEFGAGGHDTTDDPRIDSLHKHLTEHGVRLSVRQGMLRMAFHLYNTEDDMGRVLELAGQWAKTA